MLFPDHLINIFTHGGVEQPLTVTWVCRARSVFKILQELYPFHLNYSEHMKTFDPVNYLKQLSVKCIWSY